MEKDEERKIARRIVQRVAKEFRSRGFLHTRPSYLVRPMGAFVQFVHFHKFTFGPHFRIHLGVRVMNDSFEAVALNGPSFEHAGNFDASEEATFDCTKQLISIIEKKGLGWFSTFGTADELLRSPQSPLRSEDREALLDDICGRKNELNWRRSAGLLSLSDEKA